MIGRNGIWYRGFAALALCGWLSIGLACRSTPPSEGTSPITPTTAQVETSSPLPTVTPTPLPPEEPSTLTLWITELVSPVDRDERSPIFEAQILAFEATHPGLTVVVHHKKAEGKGGLEDFLTTASAAAPAVVPDLMMIDVAGLPALARKGLIAPLDQMLDPDLLSDVYPFAIQGGTVDGQLVGLPFETGVQHALYNTSKIAVPPLSWSEVFESGATYVFPTLGQGGLVNDAFLIQYLSAGGELVDSNGQPALDPQALTDVLTFYRDGLENGSILSDVLQYDTVRSGWRKYLQAEVVMANITSDLYLEGRGLLKVSRAMWVPTQAGPPAITLARGNAWVIPAREPGRVDLSVKLLTWLMNPNNMARWSAAAERLPTRRAAFEQMPRDEEEYVQFIYTQLEYAIPYPTSETHKRIYRAMQQAVDAVLRQGEPPALAAEGVLQAVNQEPGL
jgi:ABC-type glycerol-3-phosphate transport system substrate-binding protein